MPFLAHHLDDLLEELKVLSLLRMQRIPIEERDHPCRKVLSISDDENGRPVTSASTMIRLDDAAA
jgi:hypothetical protein